VISVEVALEHAGVLSLPDAAMQTSTKSRLELARSAPNTGRATAGTSRRKRSVALCSSI
jgi:hypothetical protein